MSGNDIGTYAEQFGEEFQEHMLAVAARVPGFIIRYRTALDGNYYGSAVLRAVAKALFDHVDKNQKLPTRVTLYEEIKAQVDEKLAEVADKRLHKMYTRDISDAQVVMQKTVEFGKLQAMINAVMEGAEQIEKGDRNILPLIHEATLVGEDILNVGIDFKDNLDDRVLDYIVQDQSEDDSLIPTGIPHLDYMLDGGLARQELGVILAPPKRGKTTTLVNLGFGGLSSVLGFNVVHYTLEMRDKKVIARYDDRVAGAAVKFKKSNPHKFIETLTLRAKSYLRGRLFVKGYPTRSATTSMIRTHLSLLASRGFAPDLVIVDYADIMKAERRMGEMRHEQAGIYEDLRQIAGEFNVAVWTASQAPKSALDKPTLNLGDFAEAFEKAAIVDAALAFCQTDDERLKQECRLVGIGLRNVEDGRMVFCNISRDRCLIRSKMLLDASYSPIHTPYDDEDDEDVQKAKAAEVKTTVKVKEAKGKAKKFIKKNQPSKKFGG
jgi:replicative DNA helicase